MSLWHQYCCHYKRLLQLYLCHQPNRKKKRVQRRINLFQFNRRTHSSTKSFSVDSFFLDRRKRSTVRPIHESWTFVELRSSPEDKPMSVQGCKRSGPAIRNPEANSCRFPFSPPRLSYEPPIFLWLLLEVSALRRKFIHSETDCFHSHTDLIPDHLTVSSK